MTSQATSSPLSSTDALLGDTGVPLPSRLSLTVTRSEGTDKSHHVPHGRGFVNPWPSWVKPSLYELWSGLSWWDREGVQREDSDKTRDTTRQLEILQPDFTTSSSTAAAATDMKSWWLGHAGLLIEFPGPLRILFDPIFSLRCSPTQYAGPRRFYDSPCSVEDLPPIDVVCISHNHYDHLDFDTIRGIWEMNRRRGGIKFIVPLGNRSWFQGLVDDDDVEETTIIECDWWDEVCVTLNTNQSLQIACTPAQHGSGRLGLDGGSTLWCSYYLTYQETSTSTTTTTTKQKIFFGGDTGYRLRPTREETSFPACPAFEEIHKRYGSPHYLFLPISVGSTYSYVKSWDPFGLVFPHVNGGLTAANHLDEWEAIQVAKVLSAGRQNSAQVIAIHFGTFSPHDETLRNIRNLHKACMASSWELVRTQGCVIRAEEKREKGRFYVLDHGARLDLPFVGQ